MKSRSLIILLLSTILLSACGATPPATPTPDVNAIYTAAAQTVIVELTQEAAQFTATLPATEIPAATETQVGTSTAAPTEELIATETPEPTATLFIEASPTEQFCDEAAWVADVSVQDGTQMSPGQDFQKTWRIKNTGTCIWGAGYGLIFGYGVKMNGEPIAMTTSVAPGEVTEVSVRLTAPDVAGEYTSYWRMANATGINFGEFFYAQIVVR